MTIDAPDSLITSDQLGCGVWRAIIQERGEGAYIGEVVYTSLSCNRTINDFSEASITLLNSDLIHSECCDIIRELVPYKYELLLYRNNDRVWVGPIIDATFTRENVTLEAYDLFHWFEKRLINTRINQYYQDLTDLFTFLFDIGYAQDPSPKIILSRRDTLISAERDTASEEFRRVADDMREIAESGLYFTMLDRILYVFSTDSRPFSDLPTLITEDFSDNLQLAMVGADYANDVVVTGNTDEATGFVRFGRATEASIELAGRITQVFSESHIKLDGALDLSARRRLETFKSNPLTPSGSFSPHAILAFNDLVPGCHVPLRLQVGCMEIVDTFRLTRLEVEVDVSGGVSETVTPTFQPIVDYTIT